VVALDVASVDQTDDVGTNCHDHRAAVIKVVDARPWFSRWDELLAIARVHDHIGEIAEDPSELLVTLACKVVLIEWRGVPPGGVYLVQGGDDGPIKIGSSCVIERRLTELQIGSPLALNLRAVIPGDMGVERGLHRKFALHRLHGEWFTPHQDILDLIATGRKLPVGTG
jgi:hypothetical protein